MKQARVNGRMLAEQVEEATSFFKRLKGLMGRPDLPAGQALLLAPCPQIHTCFMRFAIDVLFLSSDNTVLYVLENFKPWRLSPIVCGAAKTLEMPSGTLRGRVQKGDRVEFESVTERKK